MNTQSEYENEKDELRLQFKSKFTDLSVINQTEIHRLLWLCDNELDNHYKSVGLRMFMVPLNLFVARMIRDKGIQYKGIELKVASHYFEGREGIHILQDGRVFFCGWAGGNNHEPFINAFRRWIE